MAATLRVGETVKLAYVDQSRDSLDGSKTVWQEISDGLDIIPIGNYEMNSRSYVGRFNFKGTISRNSSRICPAANATACTWPNC